MWGRSACLHRPRERVCWPRYPRHAFAVGQYHRVVSYVGAIVLDGVVVGTGSIVMPGSLVPPFKQIPPGQVWGGLPARFLGSADPQSLASLLASCEDGSCPAWTRVQLVRQ